MASRSPTFSTLELAEHCKGWLDLDYTDEGSPAAREGTRKHEIIASHITTGATVDEPWFEPWSRHWKKYKPKGLILCEVPYAYDTETESARVLNSNGQRDYSDAKPSELVGTADLVVIDHDRVHVWDWKTGAGCPSTAEGALQLGAAAVCATTLAKVERADVAYKHVGTSRTTTKEDTLHADALAKVRARLRAIAIDTTEQRPGEHCLELWCPARHVCPAHRAAYGLPKQKSPQPQPKEHQPMAMTLASIKRGPIEEPHRILLYGVEGIGKSTFGAHSPSPIFLASERGTAELDVSRFPEPKTWNDVFDAIEALKGEHNYRTLVIDTVDWLEPICFRHVCEAHGWDSIDKPAWGAGYTAAADEWRRLFDALDTLQDERQMAVIMLGHCVTRGHRHPELDDFDRFELNVNKKAASLLKQWARTVLFCDYETCTYEEGKRTRAIDSGARWIHTNWRAAFDAKNRLGLPAKIPLSWSDFAEACDAAKAASGNKAAAVLTLAASFSDPELVAKVEDAIKRCAGDPAKLDALANKLNARKSQAA